MADEIKPIDVGITRGGVKEQYLNLHMNFVMTKTAMVANQAIIDYVPRIKSLTRKHISMIANADKQNELNKLLEEKIDEETLYLCKKNHVKPEGIIPPEIIKEATDAACDCIEGLITLYMDMFVGLEERYEILLV